MDTPHLRKFLHDLNNALNVGKIHAFLLRQEGLNSKQAEALDGIDASLDSTRDIIAKIYAQLDAESKEA
jgi:hypothetical protein